MTRSTLREAANMDRNVAIAEIKAALKSRSRKAWSVKGGRGTAWGWIRVIAPPKRCNEWGGMQADDVAELAQLFGESVHHQGVSIPASSAHYREYVARARGEAVEVKAQAYWD